MIIDFQGVMIDDARYMNIIEYADVLGLAILVHAGIDIGLPEPVHCPPDKARKVLDALHPKKRRRIFSPAMQKSS